VKASDMGLVALAKPEYGEAEMALFGKRLRAAREGASVTYRQLAAAAKLSIGFLGDVEAGRRAASRDIARQLEQALRALARK
jgi:transcriptional regulator with XRE-family HTH domain